MVIKKRISNIYKIRIRKQKKNTQRKQNHFYISFTRILKRQNLILFIGKLRIRHRTNSLTKYN